MQQKTLQCRLERKLQGYGKRRTMKSTAREEATLEKMVVDGDTRTWRGPV
jgi:hypothetical protein